MKFSRDQVIKWVLVVMGLASMGWGLKQSGVESRGNEVMVVKEAESMTVMVDVQGAVLSPGVYELSQGSRIGEAIVEAGGLRDEADEEWIAKTINQAEVIKDGQKLYLPFVEDAKEESDGEDEIRVESQANGKVNVNQASIEELESLWGIGNARAKTIMEHRPYASLDELKEKASIPQNVIEANQDRLSVF